MKPINLKKSMDALLASNDAWKLYRNTSESRYQTDETKAKAFAFYQEKRSAFIEIASVALGNALFEAQGCAFVRKITAEDIIVQLADIENNLGISKKAMDGISVDVDRHAQAFPSAYHGIPESTQFSATYKNGSWSVTDIRRSQVRSSSKAIIIHHTEESKQAILTKFTYMSV